jgi:hypothetical protein
VICVLHAFLFFPQPDRRVVGCLQLQALPSLREVAYLLSHVYRSLGNKVGLLATRFVLLSSLC